MASLTPGVLSKLLRHAGDKSFKPLGDHRTPLLQVIEIVPALSTDDSDPWRSRGFYLKLSDSEHAAYASISEEDVELISGDKIQLGQFVHISRLDLGKPVPVIRGIKPLPRRRACVGSPKDLISSDVLQPRSVRKNPNPSPKKLALHQDLKSRRESFGNGKRLVVDDMKPRRELSLAVSGRRLSLDSARRGWEQPCATPTRISFSRLKSDSEAPASTTPRLSSVSSSDRKRLNPSSLLLTSSKAGSEKKPPRPEILVCSVTQDATVTTSPLKLRETALKNDTMLPSSEVAAIGHMEKVQINCQNWFDRKILWDSLPTTMQELGKGATVHRNITFYKAVQALEEASAMENIVGCMSVFADLCKSSEKVSAGSVVESFLKVHQTMERTRSTIDRLLGTSLSKATSASGASHHQLKELSASFAGKNATAWIQAAVETDLSRFGLYSKEDKTGTSNSEKSYRVVFGGVAKETLKSFSPPNTRITCSQSPHLQKGHKNVNEAEPPLRKRFSASREVISNGEQLSSRKGLTDAASLAEKLIWVSRQWFLKYLETSLKKGFGIQGEDSRIQMTSLLGQLKRVNQWLEELVGDKHELDERIEAVRKKLYNFLLQNVDSAIHASK